jgi:hypothetical protein
MNRDVLTCTEFHRLREWESGCSSLHGEGKFNRLGHCADAMIFVARIYFKRSAEDAMRLWAN